jgi:hypothetical protein
MSVLIQEKSHLDAKHVGSTFLGRIAWKDIKSSTIQIEKISNPVVKFVGSLSILKVI